MLVSDAPRSGVDPVLDAVLFEVGGRAVTRRLVRAWAEARHTAFVARRSERARLGAGVPDDAAAVDAQLEADAAEFRYARELESSDALVAWLDARGLTVDAWWESLRRSVLERRAASGRDVRPADAAGDDADDETDEADVERADLVVSDLLADATEAFAARLAVALDARQWSLQNEAFGELEDIWTPWLVAARTEAALQSMLERERLSWLVLDLVRTTWPSDDAAREAVSCVRYDGMTLEDLAAEAGAVARHETTLLASLPEALHDALLVAAPGELVGPVEAGAQWHVMHLAAKRSPTLADPLVREAAARAVEARAAAAPVARHITWREFRP